MITLHPIDESNRRDALTLAVQPDQQRFVTSHTPIATFGLAKANIRLPGGSISRPILRRPAASTGENLSTPWR